MLKKLNFIHFVATFWIVVGIVGLYFASFRLNREIALRAHGIEAEATVVHVSSKIVYKNNRSRDLTSIEIRDLQKSGNA